MNFLFAIASTFIIYPIIYFLPIRFNTKQKFSLICISIFISFVGLLTKSVIPFWQTLLLMTAFVGLATIFISKRMTEVDEDEPVYNDRWSSPNLNEVEDVKLSINKPFEIHDPFEEEDLKTEELDMDEEQDFHEVFIQDNEMVEPLASVDSNELFFGNDEEQLIDTIKEELNFESYVTASIEPEDELEELEFQKKEMNPAPTSSFDYLSEIERLLNEEETAATIEPKAPKPKIKKEFKLEELS